MLITDLGQAYISGEKRAQRDTWRGHRKAETDWNDVALYKPGSTGP